MSIIIVPKSVQANIQTNIKYNNCYLYDALI